MHREHRDLMLVHQIGQRVRRPGCELGLHHHLDAVIPGSAAMAKAAAVPSGKTAAVDMPT